MKVTSFQHQGGRNYQEDRFWTLLSPDTLIKSILIIADGMGGHPNGHLAAEESTKELSLAAVQLMNNTCLVDKDVYNHLESAFQDINKKILSYGDARGNTLMIAITTVDKVYIMHVGDSFGSLIHADYPDRLCQVTTEHANPQGAITECIGGYVNTVLNVPLHPEFKIYSLENITHVVLATDGILDPGTYMAWNTKHGTNVYSTNDCSEHIGAAGMHYYKTKCPVNDNTTVLTLEL